MSSGRSGHGVDPWGATVPPRVLLLVCGVLLVLCTLRRGHLPPEPVLFSVAARAADWRRSLTTSLRGIRSNLRGILLTSTGPVIATAAAVAAGVHVLGLVAPRGL